jgi:hypothetical protein
MNQKRLRTTALIQLSSTNKLQQTQKCFFFDNRMLRRVGLLGSKRERERVRWNNRRMGKKRQ